MLPGDGQLSTVAVPGNFLSPDSLNVTAEVDYERGGLALNDPSLGIAYQDWRANLDIDTGAVTATPLTTGSPSVILTVPGMIGMSFAFDRNMRPSVAYQTETGSFLWFYNSLTEATDTISLGQVGIPRLTHDDKRYFTDSTSDVICAYVGAGALIYRQQRDRFLVEYTLRTGLPSSARLVNIGMNDNNRLQFELEA